MELKTAIEILDYHQEWRLGKREDMIHEPKKLTEALDIVLAKVKNLTIPVVSKSLPTEECVRDWWREDGDDDFWENEIEWSNEEVFKEIYKALIYFIKKGQ